MRCALACLTIMAVSSPAGGSAAPDEGWPQLPAPPRAALEWVAADLEYNGLPMRVLRFSSPASVAEIIALYRAHWTRGYPAPPASIMLDHATVVTQVHGPFLMTVKAAPGPDGGTTGLLAVTQVLHIGAVAYDTARTGPDDLPRPPDARVLSNVTSHDGGRRSRQVLLQTPASVDSTARYFDAALTGRGWARLHAGAGRAGHFAVYRSGARELALSITRLSTVAGSATRVLAQLTDTVARR
jgi:hypothetical protein